MIKNDNKIVIVRGGGDLATGVVQKFFRAGFNVLILEAQAPTAVRRSVSLCEAVYEGIKNVEDVTCRRISSILELDACIQEGFIAMLVDPEGKSIDEIKPAAVIDAIMAKRNHGTNRSMADVTIALGPGFCAGKDVHAVIETKRGHDLGRLILDGYARPDTGIPGEVGGESARRVVRAPLGGVVKHKKQIGDIVERGEVLFTINDIENNDTDVRASISGVLRGLIREGTQVSIGMKTADIDPRIDVDWRTISDKARCIGGAVLEAYFLLKHENIKNGG
ncbi:MAG: EF2563 family selenium-dependent molybdenum hydroxylase system protein [Oscillospiraceae bacterium]|nr:EF2563 family selenium-dependent molybdenum hydroxylase system protein [Oscillospiraceae bacterium]